ncbi:MAG: hypothetical protein PHX61_11735 [Alphaproteobacteria bacterium]|nr:hypothetical protein [Alphaproteobacteria bacterium]
MKKYLLFAFLFILTSWTLYFIFYLPNDERNMMDRVEISLENGSSDIVLVKDVTDFGWDYLCYVPPYSTKKVNFIEDKYKKNVEPDLPSFPRPFSVGEYLFIRDGKVSKRYQFKTLGIRYRHQMVASLARNIFVDGKIYLFMGENNSQNDSCIEQQNAAFKKVYFPRWDERRILITNLWSTPIIESRV